MSVPEVGLKDRHLERLPRKKIGTSKGTRKRVWGVEEEAEEASESDEDTE